MPQTSQIIPSYLHPHVATYINDNTTFTDTVSSGEIGTRFICIFLSGKGRDNVVVPMDTTADYIEEFGSPNYEKYGQAGFMPAGILAQSSARCYCMRVTADDSTYSNVAVVAMVKPATEADTDAQVYFKTVSLNSAYSNDDMLNTFYALESVGAEPNDDGFISYPLMVFRAQGHGVYGDYLRFRIVPSAVYDKDNGYKNYRVEIYDSSSTLELKETFTGSMAYDTVSNMQSIFIEDISNDIDTGSSRVEIHIEQSSLQKIYAHYTAAAELKGVTPVTLDTFPVFETSDAYNVISYDDGEVGLTVSGEVVADLTSTVGIPFGGGSDGIFGDLTSTEREDAITAKYLEAFTGQIDRKITSKRSTPAEFILDACYHDTVKTAIVALVQSRGDCYGIIDAGLLYSTSDAITWAKSKIDICSYTFGKTAQHYKIRDPYSGKIIPVTMTYHFACNIANHISNYHNGIPFVKKFYSELTGHIQSSVAPNVDADDLETKEELYTNFVNYYETINENVYTRGSQLTSQSVFSDLSEENNVYVMLEMKRKLEDLVQEKLYSFNEVEDRTRFKETAERMFSSYVGNKIRSFTVDFQSNAFEEERSILHCYLGVVFKSIVKRATIEIDINKRV